MYTYARLNSDGNDMVFFFLYRGRGKVTRRPRADNQRKYQDERREVAGNAGAPQNVSTEATAEGGHV